MNLHKYTKSVTIVLIVVFCCLIVSTKQRAESSHAIVPINISVAGKLIITDEVNDNKSADVPTLNVRLSLTPELSNKVASGKSAIRIRTNMKTWKLTALRGGSTNTSANINPSDISLTFTTQAGPKANPEAGILLSPFDKITDLSKISTLNPTDILIGKSKTSSAKDPGNKNNWFQLTTTYSVSGDFSYDMGEWDSVISYNLVSP